MPQTPFQWFVPATTGDGLVPADGYKAKFYAAGTTTPKAIYTDPGLAVPYPSPFNTAVLDAEGRALIYLGAGGYKLVVTDPSDAPIYTQDNIAGESSFGTGFVDSFADLTDVDTTLNQFTYIGGYYAPGDGGHGMFYNETSGTAADGGYVQSSTFDPTKKWFRIPDENGDVRAASFGYVPANVGVQTSSLQAADAYAAANNARLRIQYGAFGDIVGFTLTAPTVAFNQNAGLAGTGTVTFNGIVEAGGWNIIPGTMTAVLANAKQETRPEWFGASLAAPGNINAAAFTLWVAAGGGLFVVPPGTWAHTGTFVPSASKPTILYGTVGTLNTGAYYPLGYDLTAEFNLTGDANITGNETVDGNLNVGLSLGVTGDANVDGAVNGADVTAVSSVTAGTSVSGATVSATTTVTAGTNVIASGGYVQADSGSGALTHRAAGAGQVIVGATDPIIPANTLIGLYQYVKVIFGGSGTGTSPTISVTVGGITVFSGSLSNASGGTFTYHGEVLVFRTGAATFQSSGFAVINSTAANTINSVSDDRDAGAITWANGNTIVQASDAGNTKKFTLFEVYPYDGT
jgi:hypothetical protein